jgi:hypothetical protein
MAVACRPPPDGEKAWRNPVQLQQHHQDSDKTKTEMKSLVSRRTVTGLEKLGTQLPGFSVRY